MQEGENGDEYYDDDYDVEGGGMINKQPKIFFIRINILSTQNSESYYE